MLIIIRREDLLSEVFPMAANANSVELRERLVEFYSVGPVKPDVTIEDERVVIEVDIPKVEEYQQDLDRAISFGTNGEYERAKEILGELLQRYPSASDLHRMYGQAVYEQGDHDEALNYFIDALRWNPENVDALILMGNLHLRERNDSSTAGKYYDRAASLDPDNYLILNNLGGLMLKAGRSELAERYLLLALEANEEYPNTHYGLGLLKREEGQYLDAFDHALKALQISAKVDPINENAARLLFEISSESNERLDLRRVVENYRKQIEIDCGKAVEMKASDDIDFKAKVEIAENHNRDRHIVLYQPDALYHVHLLMHELVHLDFITQARSARKNMLFVTNESLKKGFVEDSGMSARFLKRKGLSDRSVSEFIDRLFHGMNNQMYNAPIDLFIENHLFESFPEIRPIQFASLYGMVSDNSKAAESREIRKMTPRHIYEANVVLNLTLTLQFRDLYGVDLTGGYKASDRLMESALSLYEEYLEIKDDRHVGEEYELIEDWAKYLKLDKYFDLIPEREHTTGEAQGDALDAIEADPLNLQDPNRKEAQVSMKESPVGSMAVTMYLVDAIQLFEEKDFSFVQEVAFEAAMLGNYGLDTEDSAQNYSLKSIPGRKFSALHILAIMYAAFRIIDPALETELNFGEEYQRAKILAQGRSGD